MRKSFAKIYESVLRFSDEVKSFCVLREYLSSENIDFEGRPVSQSVYKVDNPAERYKGLYGVDFALENQLSVGADLPLIKCDMSNLEILKSIPDGK